ncbi:MAG TPA: sulfate adenylyltransferase [Nitrososphaeraceae archaeon]|nr:sulfate adenylyltransferase [Nitrososphaeraceae archaeon]
MAKSGMPPPHGGRLVNRISPHKKNDEMFSIVIHTDTRNDIENIADGIFSPLEGFVCQDDFECIVSKGRLSNGLPWTIPIVLDVESETASKMKDAGEVSLVSSNGEAFGVMSVDDIYRFDKQKVAKAIYQTVDLQHPGVMKTMGMSDVLVGGKIKVYSRIPLSQSRKLRKTPAETRNEILTRGWKSIVGFQTRNVPHVAHEILQKTALSLFDGLFINPLIGKKKLGDYKDEVILHTYETLLDSYYSCESVMLVTLHTEMRYAGPKEAIHHAIMRKNFGCTHLIIGRDHAGVGDYYEPLAAQKIFNEYPDLEIEPVFFPAFYYCKKCRGYSSVKLCPHNSEEREELSGTKLRELVSSGRIPSGHLMRPEVAKVILSYDRPFVV